MKQFSLSQKYNRLKLQLLFFNLLLILNIDCLIKENIMKKAYKLSLFAIFLVGLTNMALALDYLEECHKKQVEPIKSRYLALTYNEIQRSFYHSPNPWDVIEYRRSGTVWCNAEEFIQSDTVINRSKPLLSKVVFTKGDLLIEAYWSQGLMKKTKDMVDEQVIDAARYSPALLIEYFHKLKPVQKLGVESNYAVYRMEIGKSVAEVYIRKNDFLLEKAIVIKNDDMLGDLATEYNYGRYIGNGGVSFAATIEIINPHNVRDTVKLAPEGFVDSAPILIEKSPDYKIEDTEQQNPVALTEKISPNIYTITLPHTETIVGLAEFRDFFVAIDAPLGSDNGELIIKEAMKINPRKPIRYFVFGHHHPWSMGGVRAFIHKGATIICNSKNYEYLKYIAGAAHTLKPDSLQIQPKELIAEIADSIRIITDGEFEMRIYLLGEMSSHTNDYSFIYFPGEKIVFEGCLVWVPLEGDITKAGKRQEGLYKGIKQYGLDVDTIIQHWPVGGKYKVKTRIPFSDLEQSVNM